MSEASSPGRAIARVDGRDKATGKQVYPSEMIADEMLGVQPLRSAQLQAQIISIDTAAAEAWPDTGGQVSARDGS